MIPVEYKIIENDKYVEGYYLTIGDIQKLVSDFQSDCHDSLISEVYIEEWLKKHERIEK